MWYKEGTTPDFLSSAPDAAQPAPEPEPEPEPLPAEAESVINPLAIEDAEAMYEALKAMALGDIDLSSNFDHDGDGGNRD